MNVPEQPWTLMYRIYRDIFPTVSFYLRKWKERANTIPNEELRKQALASIDTKTFHCEGGSIFALLSGEHKDEVIRFVVAYQTISDYLDNLCDRSTSLDPVDFEALHESMIHALTPGAIHVNYYRYRAEQDDGGYLSALVETCQDVLEKAPKFHFIHDALIELARYYCDLQVHKHVKVDERVPRLKAWHSKHQKSLPEMSWYEFSACAGSTLGIFCLVSYAFGNQCSKELVHTVKEGYFPWVQGLHILLDYLVDQEEDRLGGDLNFCSYYDNNQHLLERFTHFVKQADKSIRTLPNYKFHRLINRGLLGIYLADQKVRKDQQTKEAADKIIRLGGGSTLFFYLNRKLYERLKMSSG
ncbi:tetraprenyl-beta-curcumene synthase family protein [Fictibacillus gelatini]|uniref:tetraprenyl-beta-curcumene synthase family protein n=1 Tax=Fictibacillus gelatini TaxID=225985 RepID=UPI00047DD387|nr:tetraprenyl-beta-curcumene synthase family protein [Fictibacillus gelatini]